MHNALYGGVVVTPKVKMKEKNTDEQASLQPIVDNFLAIFDTKSTKSIKNYAKIVTLG